MINGLILTFGIYLISLGVNYLIPSINLGIITLALIFGIILGNTLPERLKKNTTQGIKFSEKRLLELSIVLMGLQLNFNYIFKAGLQYIYLIVPIIISTLFFSLASSKILKLDKNQSLLTGGGNAICGTSAIVALNPILKVSPIHMGVIIGVVNLLGTLSIFILPPLINFFDFTINQSSFLIGGSLQAIGHVAAAGHSLSEAIGQEALLIKMLRVLMIGPIVIILSPIINKKEKLQLPTFPIFIIGFIFSSLLVTLIGDNQIFNILLSLSEILLAMAMGAIGYNINLKILKESGGKLLLNGSLIFGFQLFIVTLATLFFVS